MRSLRDVPKQDRVWNSYSNQYNTVCKAKGLIPKPHTANSMTKYDKVLNVLTKKTFGTKCPAIFLPTSFRDFQGMPVPQIPADLLSLIHLLVKHDLHVLVAALCMQMQIPMS